MPTTIDGNQGEPAGDFTSPPGTFVPGGGGGGGGTIYVTTDTGLTVLTTSGNPLTVG